MKKIGKVLKVFLVWSFCFSFLISTDKNVRLYIQDMEQNPIRQVEKGVPFLLQVVVDNMNGVQQPEDIPGFEKFQVTRYGSSQSTNIINGQRTDRLIFNYALRAENLGTFRLGPLSIRDKDGAEVMSDVAHVVVGDKTIAYSVKKTPYFLETQVDKKSLYVGEELLVKIRFYYINEFENLRIVDPKFENFIVGDISRDGVVGKEIVNGAEYRYQEWLIKVYPEKTGTLIVPSVQAVFRVAADFSQSLMGIFDMFGMSSEKTVQSSARSVDVVSLPESKIYKNVTAVGHFDRAEFILKQNKGEVGEGIVATCAISGVGNFAMIKAPQLQLPVGLKYYEANSSVRKLDDGRQEKTFEYIIQAEHSGEFVIPSQKFMYFDIAEKKYKTLLTNELLLKIIGEAPIVQKKEEAASKDDDVIKSLKDASLDYVFKEDQINYVIDSGLIFIPVNSTIKNILSWLIKLLIFLSCLVILIASHKAYIGISWYETYWGYYVFVRWQLYKIIRKQSVIELYRLFEQICNRFHVELQGYDIITALKNAQMSDAKITEWQQFLKELVIFVFAQQEHAQKDKEKIMQQGQFWIKELLKVLRKRL